MHGVYTPLSVPIRPWHDVSMEFSMALPRIQRGKGIHYSGGGQVFKNGSLYAMS